MRSLLAALAVFCLAAPAARADSPPEDPAIATVKTFHNALLSRMHHEGSKLVDSIRATFNVNVMTASIAGPAWASGSANDKTAAAAALTRYLAARFEHEFDSDEGQRFQIAAAPQTRGQDKLIQTEIVQRDSPPLHLDYRLRAYDGQWRIIDIYYEGVSQVALQRADVAQGAPQLPALAKHFDEAATGL